MKPLLAIIIIALLTVPSFAQGMGGRKHRGAEQKSAQPKSKVDDKAYKAAVEQMPDRAYDPWRTVRDK